MRDIRTVSTTHTTLQIIDLGEGWILATGAQKVTEALVIDTPGTALVEEGEGFFEVGGLGLFRHGVLVLQVDFVRRWIVS